MSDAPVALVTNGGYGVGQAIVRVLDAGGYQVAVGARPGAFDNGTLKAPAEAASLHYGLMSSVIDCSRVIAEVVEEHSQIDALVCNTMRRGLSFESLIERYGSTEWDRHIAGYLSGPFYMLRSALPPMLAQGHGRIVLVLPVEGGRGSLGQAAMGVSSAGLVTLARRTAREVAGRGVTINVVVAGIVEEGFLLEDMPDHLSEQITSAVPAGRLGQRTEVADMVRYLCSPEAAYVTGQVIAVDGGFGT